MKIRFYRGSDGIKEVDASCDFIMDNGACIQIFTKHPSKKQAVDFDLRSCWIFPKSKFDKLTKGGYLEKANKTERATYYKFTPKINDFDGEFK